MANDLAPPISSITGNAVVAIIIGSLFYNLPNDTNSFFGRGVLLFFTILTNAFLGAFEVCSPSSLLVNHPKSDRQGVALWSQRPIVQKHYQYAFYHPSAEAIASMICDLPNKIILTFFFNFPLYFLANLRRTPEAFFTFCLFAFVSLLTGSVIFRTIGALSSTLTASIAPGAVFIYLMIIYTGFAIPVPYMHPWLRWFGYLNPISYAFESLMVNEVGIYKLDKSDPFVLRTCIFSSTAVNFHALGLLLRDQVTKMWSLRQEFAMRWEPMLGRLL